MSIIHDALKKLQQGSSKKTDDKKETKLFEELPPIEVLPPSGQQPVEVKPTLQNKVKSLLALLCAIAITLGAFIFLFNQMHLFFPKADRLARSLFYKLAHIKELPQLSSPAPKALVPLAKITINKPIITNQPSPTNPPIANAPPSLPKAINAANTINIPGSTNPPAPAELPAVPEAPKPEAPLTLDVHGVMSNGGANVALINDQVYQEGDEIEGVKIIKIDMDYITVNNNGKEEKIRVKN